VGSGDVGGAAVAQCAVTHSLATIDIAIVVAYLCGMIGVGVVVARRVRGFRDFFIAGGRMTTPLLVCTLVSTYYGLDVTFGTSETAFYEGVAAFVAYSAPFYLFYVLTAVLVAPRLKRLDALSLPEAVGNAYGAQARIAAAVASFVYSAPILGIAGMGLIGTVFFGLEPWQGCVIGGAVAVVYTMLGGLLADALTDTVQFVVMCVTVAVAAVVMLRTVGGPEEIGARLGPEVLAPLGTLSPWEVLVFAGVAMTPLVEPAFYQRTFAAVNARQVVKALLIGAVLWASYDWLIVYLGLAGRDLVAAGRLPAGLDGSAVILHTAAVALPPGLLGLFVAGCLATAMSTVDSYTLIAAGNVVYDGWQAATGRRLSDRNLLLATRVLVLVTMAAAIALALLFERLRDAWIFMSTVLLSTVLWPMLAVLFAPRLATRRAGRWSTTVGLTLSVALFVMFEVAGTPTVDGSMALLLPGLGAELERESALLFTLPLAALGFAAGAAADRWRGAAT
jgi:SSS family solute:Na+ symporter